MKNTQVRDYIRKAPISEFYEITTDKQFDLYSCIMCPKQYAIEWDNLQQHKRHLQNHTIINHLIDVKLILD